VTFGRIGNESQVTKIEFFSGLKITRLLALSRLSKQPLGILRAPSGEGRLDKNKKDKRRATSPGERRIDGWI